MKILGRARKSPRISENFGNASNPVFEELERFMKFSENFGNGSKVIFRCFYDFLKFSENLRKSSEVFENRRKISRRDRKVRNVSQELKSFEAEF